MYQLTAKDKNGNLVVLDNKIPDEHAEQHTAEYCGQFYPNHTEFDLQPVNDNLTTENKPTIS